MNKYGVINAKKELVFVYVLCDPRTNEVRYVGETVDIKSRMRNHWNNSVENRKMLEWIKELKGLKLLPIVKVISTVSRRECYNEEQRVIELYRNQGCLLFNGVGISKNTNRSVKKICKGNRILWKETGHIFNSASEAGRYFGVTGGTIMNNVNQQSEINGIKVISMPYRIHRMHCGCSEWVDYGCDDFRYCPWCGGVLEKIKEGKL